MQNQIRGRRRDQQIKEMDYRSKKKKKGSITMSVALLLLLLFSETHAMPSPEPDAGRRRLGQPETLQASFITYEVLRRDKVPCDRPGIPYYSCRGSRDAKANPYVRGCSIIAGCREGSP